MLCVQDDERPREEPSATLAEIPRSGARGGKNGKNGSRSKADATGLFVSGRLDMATILIVDDLLANRQVLVTLLRHQGHRLLEAADGSEGLAAVQAEHPDLVITDVLMPVMDGYELVRQLRLDPTTSRIPVVFYTAHYGEREARALALSIGVSDVLTKPAESAEVLKIVGRALGQVVSPKASDFSSTLTARILPDVSPPPTAFDREHLRLVTEQALGEGR